MSWNSTRTFGIPADGYAVFARDERAGYVHRRGRLTIRVIGEVEGSVLGSVRLSPAHGLPAHEASCAADSFVAFQRAFQAMVALGHDGTRHEAALDWDDDAFWLASVPWSIDTSPPF